MFDVPYCIKSPPRIGINIVTGVLALTSLKVVKTQPQLPELSLLPLPMRIKIAVRFPWENLTLRKHQITRHRPMKHRGQCYKWTGWYPGGVR